MAVILSIGFILDCLCVFGISSGFENLIILSSKIITLNASSTLFVHLADVSIYGIFKESAKPFKTTVKFSLFFLYFIL